MPWLYLDAVHAYFDFLNNELHNTTSEYGLCEYALVTGFVGLAAADLVRIKSTFQMLLFKINEKDAGNKCLHFTKTHDNDID